MKLGGPKKKKKSKDRGKETKKECDKKTLLMNAKDFLWQVSERRPDSSS